MELTQRHIDALNEAETLMFHTDFCPYLELKELVLDPAPLARRRFRVLFTNYYGYYGLNVGGLTDVFIDRFFQILFAGNVIRKRQTRLLDDPEQTVFDSPPEGGLCDAVLFRVEAGGNASGKQPHLRPACPCVFLQRRPLRNRCPTKTGFG